MLRPCARKRRAARSCWPRRPFPCLPCYPLLAAISGRHHGQRPVRGPAGPGGIRRGSPRVLPRLPGTRSLKSFWQCADHFVFNSPGQRRRVTRPRARAAGKAGGPAGQSRSVPPRKATPSMTPVPPVPAWGPRWTTLTESLLPLLDGLHFHTLCEQNSDALETTAAAFEEKFGKYLPGMKWLNLGGGHHITRADYDVQRLIRVVKPSPGELRGGSISGAGRGGGAKRRIPGIFMCWKWSTTGWTLPFWTPPLPATCRMCWKCPTVPLCGMQGNLGKKPIPTGWPVPPAWPGT